MPGPAARRATDAAGADAPSAADRLLAGVARIHPLAFFTVAAVALAGPHLWPATRISELSYDAPDALIHLWNFWWTAQWLGGLSNPYWTDLLYHPFGTSLAVHGYALPYSVLLVPLQWVAPGVAGLAAAFNAVVFASFVLSGIGAYRLALRLTDHRVGSLVAGLVFAYTPFHFLNMARLNLVCIEFMPFYVYALLACWDAPTLRRSAALAGWLALCFYSSLEYALYLVLFSVAWVVLVSIAERRLPDVARLRGLAAAALAFVALAAPLLVQQARVAAHDDAVPVDRKIEEIVYYSPALLSFVTPSRVHPVYGETFRFAGVYPDESRWGMRSETSIGVATWILAAVALWQVRRGRRGVWLVCALVFLVLCLGPKLRVSGTWLSDVTLPYAWLYAWVPPLRGGRDPTRIFPLAVLMLAVLSAFGTKGLLEAASGPRRAWLGLAILGLVGFESLTVLRPRLVPSVPPIYERLAADGHGGPIADLTPSLSGMLAQTVHGRPIGYVFGIALRGAPTFDRFEVESVFSEPRRVLDAPPSDAARTLDALRDEIRRRPVELALFPSSPIAGRQQRVARLLDAPLSSEGGYSAADFRALAAARGPRETAEPAAADAPGTSQPSAESE